jgi:hypothetical protein
MRTKRWSGSRKAVCALDKLKGVLSARACGDLEELGERLGASLG